MYNPQIAAYLGNRLEEGFTGFTAENGLYVMLSSEVGLTEEQGSEFLKKLAIEISTQHIEHLADFERFLIEKLKDSNIPTHSSLACLLVKGETCFLKAMGQGKIYLRRGSEFATLIEGDNSASGYIYPDDFFIFTTAEFTEKIIHQNELAHIAHHKSPIELRDALMPIGKAKTDTGAIALFVQFVQLEEVLESLPPESPLPAAVVEEAEFKSSKTREFFVSLRTQYERQGKKKILTFVAVFVIFLIFIWSVLFGYQRRTNARLEKDIQVKTEIITENLAQAEEVVFLNVSRAQALIASSKTAVEELKKEAGTRKVKEITALENLIKEKEGKIFNKEEKPTEEFFDLSVDNPDIRGKNIALDKDNLVILDPAQGLFLLSIPKKSLDKENPKEVKKAGLVGISEDVTYFLTSDGLVQINQDRVKKVIDQDKDWGNIVDFAFFNNNIYMLDPTKNQIYKYTPTEAGYSAKSLYFKPGQSVKLDGAVSVAIDSSVYIGLESAVLKFTAGVPEDFRTTFPDTDTTINKIVTNADMEKVYVWDKKKGIIYVLAKTGSYERQIRAAILKEADDFVVFNDSAYILNGSKIHRMSVE